MSAFFSMSPTCSLIAFEERVTFWLQRGWSLPCACVCCIVRMCGCVMFTCKPYMQIMQHTCMHKAVTRCVEAKKLLSRWGKWTIALFRNVAHHNVWSAMSQDWLKFCVSYALTEKTTFIIFLQCSRKKKK